MIPALAAIGAVFFLLSPPAPGPTDYFKITVVDEDTGRGVPLVELRTTAEVRYYTDSNGIVAFYEPGLMDREVYFYISSHGYEFPKDLFGHRGRSLKVTGGGSAVLKIKRLNVAERLYRVTGEGVYRDSILVGHPAPIKQPLLNAQVTGQDTVMATPYRGRIYWFFGDTDKLSSSLGNLSTSGATSEWPGKGGLDPTVGVDLTYFVDKSGFSRPMAPIPGPGLKWIEGLMTVPDEKGAERLVCWYQSVKNLGENYETGLAVFNDATATFERLTVFPRDAPLHPAGRPFLVSVDGRHYYYFPSWAPNPLTRVKADLKHITDPAAYEGFTCEREAGGRLACGWKAGAAPVDYDRQQKLIAEGKLKPEEGLLQLQDFETGVPIKGHSGSVYWNDFRKRWIMLAQSDGGMVWYLEGDTPVGPWVYARKIVSHDNYTFYWPGQHPFFDQDGGRVIYFQGTYTELFANHPQITPRYNYNQIMYRLRLDDPRLFLPVPVYRARNADGRARYMLREAVDSQDAWSWIEEIAFFAVPPDRPRRGLIPVVDQGRSLFYALPPEAAPDETKSAAVIPLYSARPSEPSGKPIARVWRNPMSVLVLDRNARPVSMARPSVPAPAALPPPPPVEEAKPAPEIKHDPNLEALSGDWEGSGKFWTAPAGLATQFKTKSEYGWEPSIAERLLLEQTGEVWAGTGVFGRDQEGYTLVWMDYSSTAIRVFRGAYDAAGKVFTFEGAYNPVTRARTPTRWILRIVSDKEHHWELLERQPDGSAWKVLEVRNTRASP